MKNCKYVVIALFLSFPALADDLGKYNLPYGTDGVVAVGQSAGHCMVWDGSLRQYDYPGMPETGCYAMNNAGWGVGEAHSAYTSIKFKIDLTTGTMSALSFAGPAGMTMWMAEDIDDSGGILIRYTQRSYNAKRVYVYKTKGCILVNGACTYTYPDYPGARATYYNAVNNAGDAVGIWFDTANRQRGFVYWKATGVFQSIEYPAAIETSAVELNDNGTVVGHYCVNKPSSYCEQSKGFTWSTGNWTVYDKGYSTILTGIGNNGRVSGQVWVGNQFYKETFGFLE